MVKCLGDLRAKQQVLNYHTKNGVILARNAAEKRYACIQSWFGEKEIIEAMNGAPVRPEKSNNLGQGRFLRSQTLESIPRDLVVKRTAGLEEIAEVRYVETNRQKRKPKANVN